ncbi:hypothetical protein AMTRI_Chr02g218000 [Amborella trichopoda]
MMVDKLEVGSDGRVAAVRLKNESLVEADTAIVGIGAKPAIGPFEILGLKNFVGGIQVDSQFRTSIPGIFSIGDVAGFPLKIYDQMVRVEHVDHARKSAQHCVKALLSIHTQPCKPNALSVMVTSLLFICIQTVLYTCFKKVTSYNFGPLVKTIYEYLPYF